MVLRDCGYPFQQVCKKGIDRSRDWTGKIQSGEHERQFLFIVLVRE